VARTLPLQYALVALACATAHHLAGADPSRRSRRSRLLERGHARSLPVG
jgi:hypothetical protein